MILDVNIVKENIGKKIRWSVEGYAGQNYGGISVVEAMTDGPRPLKTKVIEGDDLSFAYLEDFGFSMQDGYLRNDASAPHVFSYSDADRFVKVLAVEDNG